MDTEVFCCQQRVDPHSGGILGQEFGEVSLDLIDQALRRIIRVHQIAKIDQSGIAPVSTVPSLQQGDLLVRIRVEDRFGNIQILNIVDLIPEFSVQTFCHDSGIIQHSDHAQNLLVVLILPQSSLVRIQERNIVGFGKMTAEFIDVNSLIVVLCLIKSQFFPRHKGLNTVIR